jgi:hypothetical protein
MTSDDQHKTKKVIVQEVERLHKRNQRFDVAVTVIWLTVIALALWLFFALLPY